MSKAVAILGPNGKPLERPKKPRRPVYIHPRLRARYDAAQTNDDNSRHWANSDGLSAASANTEAVRSLLRNRSRYEYDNNGYANGIVRTRADDLIGTGPTLQILTEDDALNETIEQLFTGWAKAARLAEKLHTMDQARDRDGESFALLTNNLRIDHPIKLDLVLVEADRVADPAGSFASETFDGITYDRFGNPLSYLILRDHPGDTMWGITGVADEYAAEFILHWYRCDRPGQLRGVPELTSSLPLFAYMRRFTLATLAAAETAANFAALLETESSGESEEEEPTPFEALEIERNMMTTLPAGVTAKQLAAEHPATTYPDFKREILNECGRPVRMPSNVVGGDSSKHNFSSAKLDHFGYRGALRVDRTFAELNVLDKILRLFSREARFARLVSEDVMLLPRAWYWPGWPSMDKDTAGQDTERLKNGTTTLSELLAEWGQDWKAVIRQRGRELRFMQAEGVPPPDGAAAPPEPPPTPEDGEPPADEDEEVDEEQEEEAVSSNGFYRRGVR